ncbi:MAG TPA: hypothetical protein PK668_03740 [Myxococcota bacterium]|nr:hypothetical protein [Myxococcota bacterium]HRY91969.1 hypothetical protein [Myxococcota bacterium]HSA21385.1 hypothetical protein [Myxococcota bacterium]
MLRPVGEGQKRPANLYTSESEDTDPGLSVKRFFLVRWYRGLTHGMGQSRSFFLPFGILALCGLGFHLGFPALQEGIDLLLRMAHATLGIFGQGAQGFLDLPARHAAVEVGALLWAVLAALWLCVLSMTVETETEGLGYVVPGSGLIARCWAVIGKRLYQLKQSFKVLAAYLRDLNLAKLHLPATVPLVVLLGFFGLADALDNGLREVARIAPGLAEHPGWIPVTAQITAAVVAVVLGLPMLLGALVRAHRRSVQARERKQGLVHRFLRGLPGLLILLPPVAWMVLSLLAGRLG